MFRMSLIRVTRVILKENTRSIDDAKKVDFLDKNLAVKFVMEIGIPIVQGLHIHPCLWSLPQIVNFVPCFLSIRFSCTYIVLHPSHLNSIY